MAPVSGSLLLGVVVLGIAAPIHAMMENHHHGNWTFSPPDLCPHNDSHTHVCSSMDELPGRCLYLICCNHINEMTDEIVLGDDADSSEAVDETEDTCDGFCLVIRNCTLYQCLTDCCEGYQRDKYGRCQIKTEELECKNGGTKEYNWGGAYCKCPHNFYGRTCDKYECHCRNGECVLNDGQPMCKCTSGFYGEFCEQHRCGMPCHNGGNCVTDGVNQMCNCTVGYVGKNCESKYLQSERCPPAEFYPSDECYDYCYHDGQCPGDKLCCQSGCRRQCRSPMCNKNGHTFAVGEIFRPTPCERCECLENGEVMCAEELCAMPMCKAGMKPVTHPGKCCPVCEDDKPPVNSPPPKIECSRYPVQIDLPPQEDKVALTRENTKVRAWDHRGNQLKVMFEPTCVKHCHCRWTKRHIEEVAAYAEDSAGNKARCKLDVYVKDSYAPVFTTCPENVYAFEGELVTWKDPTYHDNVGIPDDGVKCYWQKDGKRGSESCSRIKGQRLSAGNYTVSYVVSDFDSNTGRCIFHLGVMKEDTPWNNLPEGLRERSRDDEDKFNIALVVGPIIGAIGIFALVVALCLWFRMKKQCRSEAGRQRQAPPMMRQNYDNNIYHLPTDVSVKPPPYSLPTNPPPYSSGGDMKDGEYAYIDPPTYAESSNKSETGYDNPEYVTLGSGTKSEV